MRGLAILLLTGQKLMHRKLTVVPKAPEYVGSKNIFFKELHYCILFACSLILSVCSKCLRSRVEEVHHVHLMA
jgi:hypothetical protein